MADGTSRAVEAIHAGDYVLAKDEKTGKVEAQEVTATVHHPAATLVTVTFAEADGKVQAIVCTPEHPFFVDGKGWVEAGSLGIGTSIVTRAGPVLAVKGLDWQRSAQTAPGLAPGLTTPAFTVYNFTVDASHTFFVGTANGGAWTHNSCTIAHLTPGIGGGVTRGKQIPVAWALDRIRRGGNVFADTEKEAKSIAKAVFGQKKPINEIHGSPADGFFPHYHDADHGPGHIFFPNE